MVGTTQVSVNRWMDKEHVRYIDIYIDTQISFSHEKEGNLSYATTWMNLEGIKLSEGKSEKKQILCDLTYIWNSQMPNLQK